MKTLLAATETTSLDIDTPIDCDGSTSSDDKYFLDNLLNTPGVENYGNDGEEASDKNTATEI